MSACVCTHTVFLWAIYLLKHQIYTRFSGTHHLHMSQNFLYDYVPHFAIYLIAYNYCLSKTKLLFKKSSQNNIILCNSKAHASKKHKHPLCTIQQALGDSGSCPYVFYSLVSETDVNN